MIKHPAKYSDVLLPILAQELEGCQKILDPMAGTGKIRLIRPDAYLNELEKEWIEQSPAAVGEAETIRGDALELPWPDSYFDAVVTSPTYSNRMADHHNARDASKRNTYRHTLGRELSPNNSGQLQWGKEYRRFHYEAWLEVRRVLRPNGRFVLNISDHFRKGKLIPVTRFHHLLLLRLGFDLEKRHEVITQRQRQGQNAGLRAAFESILVYRVEKEAKVAKENVFFDFWPDLESCPDGNDPFPHYPISGQE